MSISDKGLAPDYEVTRTPEERLNNIDPQKEAAFKFLAGEELNKTTTQ